MRINYLDKDFARVCVRARVRIRTRTRTRAHLRKQENPDIINDVSLKTSQKVLVYLELFGLF